jgi:hypothetical protein
LAQHGALVRPALAACAHARDATDYRGTGDESVTPAPAHMLNPSNNAPVVAIGDVHGDVEFLIGQLSTHPCI